MSEHPLKNRNARALQRQLAELQLLARFQRSVRLGMRTLWLGMAGVLFGWGTNALWGWWPDPRTWLVMGLVAGTLPLLALLFSFSPRSQWVWSVDRRLELQEQVSTAWDAIQNRRSELLSGALIVDVLRLLPGVRARMLRRGWFFQRDLVALIITTILVGLVMAFNLTSSFAFAGGETITENTPFLGEDPTAEDVFPQGPLGLSGEQGGSRAGETPGGERGRDEGNPSSGADAPTSSGGDSEALADALRDLGDALSEQAPTYDLGESLQEMDLSGAADELEDLADQLEGLSAESRRRMAEAMQQAVEAVEQAGESGLAQDLQDAAGALQSGDETGTQAARDALDRLAEDLRDLAQEDQTGRQADSGSGAGGEGSGTSGAPEPSARLQGEGGNFELPLDDSSNSSLLSPAPPGAAGEGTVGGSMDSTTGSGDDVVPGYLAPNSYLWKWRDVVSSYFDRLR